MDQTNLLLKYCRKLEVYALFNRKPMKMFVRWVCVLSVSVTGNDSGKCVLDALEGKRLTFLVWYRREELLSGQGLKVKVQGQNRWTENFLQVAIARLYVFRNPTFRTKYAVRQHSGWPLADVCTLWEFSGRVRKEEWSISSITSSNASRFSKFFSVKICWKFAIKRSLNIPPYLKRVATLPCDKVM